MINSPTTPPNNGTPPAHPNTQSTVHYRTSTHFILASNLTHRGENQNPERPALDSQISAASRRGRDGGGWLMLDAAQQTTLFVDRPVSCLYGSRGCLGCCSKPTPFIVVDAPSKGLRIQGRTVKKPGISDDFWSTSTYEMDNSGIQSQRSISSISTSTQNPDPHGAASTSNPTEFVNHGLLLWNQTRHQWVGNRRPETRMQEVKEPRLSWNVTYDSLLGTNKPFPQHIPLSEMVDFLVDVWEQEGMYD